MGSHGFSQMQYPDCVWTDIEINQLRRTAERFRSVSMGVTNRLLSTLPVALTQPGFRVYTLWPQMMHSGCTLGVRVGACIDVWVSWRGLILSQLETPRL